MQMWAAYVLSMVFGNRHPEPLGADAFPEQTPCLEGLLLGWSAAAIGGSRFDKHGFVLIGVLIPGDVNCRGFFGLLFSYPFGLFIPRVLDT